MKAIITIPDGLASTNSDGELHPPPLRTAAHLPGFTVTGITMRLHAADWQYWLDDRPRILRLARLPYPQLRPAAWPAACAAARAGGVHGLLVPISWAHHAPAPGVLDLDGSTAAQRDVSRLLAIIADADLGLVPVTDTAQLPAWLRGTSGEHPHLADREHQEAADNWHEAVVQTVAAIAPDATLLWALAEPPGPDRATAAAITAYQSWLATRYDDSLDLAREWQRDVESFRSVAAPGPGAVPTEQRDWRRFDVSVRAETLGRLAQPIREYLPEVSTALLVPDTRQALARAVQLQAVADDAGTLPDLLATVAAGEPSIHRAAQRAGARRVAPDNRVAVTHDHALAEQAGRPAPGPGALAAEHGRVGAGGAEPRLERHSRVVGGGRHASAGWLAGNGTGGALAGPVRGAAGALHARLRPAGGAMGWAE